MKSTFHLLLIVTVVSLTIARPVTGQTITQIMDATGDGVGHTLTNPLGVAVDGSGNIYVTGYFSHNAFKITPAGVVTQIIEAAGDGLGHGLSGPTGIAVDNSGNVYVSGRFSNNVFKITPSGTVTQIIDGSGDGLGNTLNTPGRTLAVDAAQNVYVTGRFSDNVFKIAPGGTVTEIIDAAGDGLGHALDLPIGLAVDPAGNVYVTGHYSDNVFKITTAGSITQIADASGDGAGNALGEPYEIAVDGSGNAFVAGSSPSNVLKISPGGSVSQIMDVSGDGSGNLLVGPTAVAVDPSGNVYVGAYAIDNVFQITPGGAITQILGSSGDGVHPMDNPLGIATDAAGNVFVTSHNTHSVFKITLAPPNATPIADAGPDQTVTALQMVQLDGSGSFDPDSDPITYHWNIVTAPVGSGSVLSDNAAVDPSFSPDLAGFYEIELVVNDGLVDSAPDTVMVMAQSAEESTDEVGEEIEELVVAGDLNAGQGNALVSSLDAALSSLASGDTAAAIEELNAFINKVEAKIKSNKLDLSVAEDLIDSANAVLAALGADTVGKGVTGPAEAPTRFALEQNYPNPFNPSTTIAFDLAESGHVRLQVFDMLGRHVMTLLDTDVKAGVHAVSFDAANLPSGTYLYRIQAGAFTESRTMLLMK
jgi:hypothetical protein